MDVPEIDLDRQLVALARLLIGHRADEIEGLVEMPERLGAGGGARCVGPGPHPHRGSALDQARLGAVAGEQLGQKSRLAGSFDARLTV